LRLAASASLASLTALISIILRIMAETGGRGGAMIDLRFWTSSSIRSPIRVQAVVFICW